jgi:ATP synthase protein I
MIKPGRQPVKEGKAYLWLKYSGIAFQLAMIILAAVWGGGKLDQYFSNEVPFITILLIIVFFSGFLYKLYLDLVKPPK